MSVLNYITLSHLKKVIAGITQRFIETDNKIDDTKKYITDSVESVNTEITNIKSGAGLNGKLIKRGSGAEAEIFNAEDMRYLASTASGQYSHAGGYYSDASGDCSYAEGSENADASGFYLYLTGEPGATTYTVESVGGAYDSSNFKTLVGFYISKNSGVKIISETVVNENLPNAQITSITVNHSLSSGAINHKCFYLFGCLATGDGSYAKGYQVHALSPYSHAEGVSAIAEGRGSYAQGECVRASGQHSHANGYENVASGDYSHAEGSNTIASGRSSHAEGEYTTASGTYSHAEGEYTIASGMCSCAEGYNTIASGTYSHTEGNNTTASGLYSHAEGFLNKAGGNSSHVEGGGATCYIALSGAAGALTYTVDGNTPIWVFDSSFFINARVVKYGESSRPIYSSSKIVSVTLDNNNYLTSIILDKTLDDAAAVSRKSYTIYYGSSSYGSSSHAEGFGTYAKGHYSHSEGVGTIAYGSYQHVQGKYNEANNSYAHIVGNGTNNNTRSNAHTLDWQGNGWYAGKLTVGTAPTNDMDVATKKYVDDNVGGTNADWEENDNTDPSYILNKPSIKAGTGENSIVEGVIEQHSNSGVYTLYLTGGANATTYSYTCEETLPNGLVWEVIKYGLNFYLVDGIAYNGTVTVTRTLSASALDNVEVTLYRYYKDALGTGSHAEGHYTFAGRNYAHAEGMSTQSLNIGDHAEGSGSKAVGGASHAEGLGSISYGRSSHAEGKGTIATSEGQHTEGRYNIEDTSGIYAHIVGNGTGTDIANRSNAHTLDWSGNGWYAGKLTIGTGPTNDMDVATKQYVDDSIPVVPTKVSDLTNDSGFITSYTETDPIFVASAAHGITSSDISNWNSKTSLTLGTTSSTAYRGDYGQSAYTHAVTNKGSAFSSGLYKITTNSEGHVTGATAVVKTDITGLGIPAQDTTYTFDGTYNSSTNKAATVSTVTNAVSGKANSSDVLTKTNTTSYTPSGDYNPATKKYVDDATAGITTDLSGLTDTTITTPTDGQLLRYNSTTSKWENVTLSLAISGNTIQLKEGNTVISSVTLPIYNGGVSS